MSETEKAARKQPVLQNPAQIASYMTRLNPLQGLDANGVRGYAEVVQLAIEVALKERGLGERPEARVIHIAPTDEQWAVIDSISYGPAYVAESGENDGVLKAYRVEDDNLVELYTIAPDGEHTYEALTEGFHSGWTTYNSEGEILDGDEDDEDGDE